MEHQARLINCSDKRSEQENPQQLHKAFKDKILKMIRKRSKEIKLRILWEISALKKDQRETLNNTFIDNDSKREEAAILDERIKNLEMQRFARARDTVAMDFFLYDETITKLWINMNKEEKSRR